MNIAQPAEAARSLLATLLGEKGNDNDSKKSKKRNCRDFLRSKAIPSPQVLEAAMSNKEDSDNDFALHPEVLLHANKILLQEYATFSKLHDNEDNDDEASPFTSLQSINKLVVIFRFIQLLLLREPLVEKNPSLPPDQCDKLVTGLLETTCQGLCGLVESFSSNGLNGDNDEDIEENMGEVEDFDIWSIDISSTLDPRPVIGFAISWLLRINHHYVKTRIALMAPLWRGICNVLTTAANSPSGGASLPPELLEDALRALSSYLVEGRNVLLRSLLPSTPSEDTGSPLVDSALQVKLILFLILRTSALMKLVQNPEESSVVSAVWGLLAGFRGMAPALQLHKSDSCSPAHFQIGTKVQKQVSELALSHHPSWNALLSSDFKDYDDDGSCDDWDLVIRSSIVLGKVLLLQWILRDIVSAGGDVEPLAEPITKTCECLVSQAIPQCHFALGLALLRRDPENPQRESAMVATLVPTSLQVMSCVLAKIEKEKPSIRSQLHRVMCRWANQDHPLSKETSLGLMYLYLELTEDNLPFLSAVVGFLFDYRTSTLLRSNLAALLARVLCNDNIKTKAEQIIEYRFLALMGKTRKCRKRKRSRPEQVSWLSYGPEDIKAICIALRNCRGPSEPVLGVLRSFCRRCKENSNPSEDTLLRQSSTRRVAVLMACVQGFLLGCKEKSQQEAAQFFFEVMGVSVSELVLAFVHFIERSRMLAGDNNDSSAAHKAMFLSSVLKFCREASTCFGLDDIPAVTGEVCRILVACADEPKLSSSHEQRAVLFDVVMLLQSMGSAIPSSCEGQILKDIQGVFYRLLSSSHWPLKSHAISALTVFGSTLNASHQSILPSCLPKSCLGLFQSRVQGRVWRRGVEPTQDGETEMIGFQSRLLEKSSSTREMGRSVFPSSATLQILEGSFFLQMPTQEGRQALVIFPPGPQSIVDIKHMYAMQDCDELPEIQSLKRIVVSVGGVGTCLLHAYTQT